MASTGLVLFSFTFKVKIIEGAPNWSDWLQHQTKSHKNGRRKQKYSISFKKCKLWQIIQPHLNIQKQFKICPYQFQYLRESIFSYGKLVKYISSLIQKFCHFLTLWPLMVIKPTMPISLGNSPIGLVFPSKQPFYISF